MNDWNSGIKERVGVERVVGEGKKEQETLRRKRI